MVHIDTLQHYFEIAFDYLDAGHLDSSSHRFAQLKDPDLLFLGHDTMLVSDVKAIWVEWFVHSILDLKRVNQGRVSGPHLAKQVMDGLEILTPGISDNRREELSKVLVPLILQRRRSETRRVSYSLQEKRSLLINSGKPARCWICGVPFPEWAKDKFLRREHEAKLPKFGDVFLRRGLKPRDLEVEIEHRVPFSAGGTNSIENLALSCGWCNTGKGDRKTIYDPSKTLMSVYHPMIGTFLAPCRFWIVRTLTFSSGCVTCGATTSEHELSVYIRNSGGVPVPPNLATYCREHHPLKEASVLSLDGFEQRRLNT